MNAFERLLYRWRGIVVFPEVDVSRTAVVQPFTILGTPLHPEDAIYCTSHFRTVIGDECHVGPHAVIYRGASLGRNVIVEPFCRIGGESIIGEGTRVVYGARIHERVIVGQRCVIAGNCSDEVRIGNRVKHFGRLAHSFDRPEAEWSETGEGSPIIEDGAVIGANALIIGPVTIGARSFIAAGEIVRASVPPGHIFYKGAARSGREWQGRLKQTGFFSDEHC